MGARRVLLLAAICLASIAPARAGEPTAKDLIKLAPVITSKDPAYETIAVSATIKGDVHLRIRAIYQAPNRHAMLISDGSDGTPLVFVADRQMLIYDPVHPAVLRIKDAVSQLTLRSDGNLSNLEFNFGKNSHEVDSSELTLDFRSICLLPAVEEKVVRDGDGRYRLFLTKADEKTAVHGFDPSRKMPYASFKAFTKDSHEPSLNIDRIEVNVVLRDEEFRFPDMALLAKKIEVKDWPGDRFSQTVGGVALLIRAMEARAGANHPGMRKSIKFASWQGIHWDQVREHDRKFSNLIKDFLPPEPIGPRAPLELPPLPPEKPRPAALSVGLPLP
jgi:hypothetical protein